MIREFWVKNFLSIRDRQELSFVAKGPVSELVSEVADGVFLYKLGILYGANASGKSNMVVAVQEVFRLLVSSKSDANVGIDGFTPFALTRDEPVEMGVSFYADGVRYDYYVKFDRRHILAEELYYYPKGSKSLFYERRFVGENVQADIKFGAGLRLLVRTQERVRENTLNNHSVLSVCAKTALREDIAPFNELYGCIMDNYHVTERNSERRMVDILEETYVNPKMRRFFNTMLQKADLNILGYKPVVEERLISEGLREHIQKEDFPEGVKETLLRATRDSAAFVNHSASGDFDIPLEWQSKGTLRYLGILDALYDMVTGSHVYCLDELGEDLHNDLLYYYLSVFIFNSDKSQLIITSQETTLLSQDLINENRGVVWFVEKNGETASSEYSRGDSFGLHKNLSLYNSYRIGRLGAKPELGGIFLNLED